VTDPRDRHLHPVYPAHGRDFVPGGAGAGCWSHPQQLPVPARSQVAHLFGPMADRCAGSAATVL